MTKQELSQIYWLTLTINEYEQKLHDLENCGYKSVVGVSRGKSGNISNPTGNLAVKIAEYKELIKEKYIEVVERKIAAEHFISGIDDVQLRLVMRLRFIELQGWLKIARAIGSYNESTPRMMVDRFFAEK